MRFALPTLLSCALLSFATAQLSPVEINRGPGSFAKPVPNRAPLVDDPLLMSLGDPAKRDAAIQSYQNLGKLAVPQLLEHLQHKQQTVRMLATSALQYAWSEDAIDPLLRQMTVTDPNERKMAWAVLNQQLDRKTFDAKMDPILHKLDPELVGSVLTRLELESPDELRIRRLAAQTRYWPIVLPSMHRYQSAGMRQVNRPIAAKATGRWKALAIAAMIQHGDRDPLARKTVIGWLKDRDPRVREYAAEYLRWHGTAEALRPLKAAAATETDIYAEASTRATIAVIEARGQQGEFPEGAAIEPVFRYGRSEIAEAAASAKRIPLLRTYAGYPLPAKPGPAERADKLIAPTRDFWASNNNSFGSEVPQGDGPFAGTVHIGDDVSWWKEMATVVAIAPGVVKHVRAGAPSWGGLVVLEHTRDDGSQFCSVYAHLGPMICVRAGDAVRQGEKLGALGRSFTWENGGYGCHLHFGLHKGGYKDGKWLTGYINPRTFRGGRHQWIRPRDVIPPATP